MKTYYVSGTYAEVLDISIEVKAENPYMATLVAKRRIEDELFLEFDLVIINDVAEVEAVV